MKSTLLKISAFVLFFSLSGAGCEKEDALSVCGVNDPITNLDWLRNIKADLEKNAEVSYAEIILYRLDEIDYVYIQKSMGTAHDLPNTIYDCEGNEKYICGPNQPINNCLTFFSKAQKINTIWKKE